MKIMATILFQYYPVTSSVPTEKAVTSSVVEKFDYRFPTTLEVTNRK
jgi:hypothetical protein